MLIRFATLDVVGSHAVACKMIPWFRELKDITGPMMGP